MAVMLLCAVPFDALALSFHEALLAGGRNTLPFLLDEAPLADDGSIPDEVAPAGRFAARARREGLRVEGSLTAFGFANFFFRLDREATVGAKRVEVRGAIAVLGQQLLGPAESHH